MLSLIISGIEIEGRIERDKKKILDYFTKIKLPLSDSRYISRQFDKLNLEYNTKKDLTCKYCNHTQEGVEMPIVHQNFLWI